MVKLLKTLLFITMTLFFTPVVAMHEENTEKIDRYLNEMENENTANINRYIKEMANGFSEFSVQLKDYDIKEIMWVIQALMKSHDVKSCVIDIERYKTSLSPEAVVNLITKFLIPVEKNKTLAPHAVFDFSYEQQSKTKVSFFIKRRVVNQNDIENFISLMKDKKELSLKRERIEAAEMLALVEALYQSSHTERVKIKTNKKYDTHIFEIIDAHYPDFRVRYGWSYGSGLYQIGR